MTQRNGIDNLIFQIRPSIKVMTKANPVIEPMHTVLRENRDES